MKKMALLSLSVFAATGLGYALGPTLADQALRGYEMANLAGRPSVPPTAASVASTPRGALQGPPALMTVQRPDPIMAPTPDAVLATSDLADDPLMILADTGLTDPIGSAAAHVATDDDDDDGPEDPIFADVTEADVASVATPRDQAAASPAGIAVLHHGDAAGDANPTLDYLRSPAALDE